MSIVKLEFEITFFKRSYTILFESKITKLDSCYACCARSNLSTFCFQFRSYFSIRTVFLSEWNSIFVIASSNAIDQLKMKYSIPSHRFQLYFLFVSNLNIRSACDISACVIFLIAFKSIVNLDENDFIFRDR